MFLTDSMVRTSQWILDITYHGIDQVEVFILNFIKIRCAIFNNLIMVNVRIGQGLKAGKPIWYSESGRHWVLLSLHLNFIFTKAFNGSHSHVNWVVVFFQSCGSNEKHLVCRTSTTPSLCFTAPICIIELHYVIELSFIITCMSLCFMYHAMLYETSISLGSSNVDMPFLTWVSKKMARNHLVNGSLVLTRIVPEVRKVCWRKGLHWYRECCFSLQYSLLLRLRQTNPLPHLRVKSLS